MTQIDLGELRGERRLRRRATVTDRSAAVRHRLQTRSAAERRTRTAIGVPLQLRPCLLRRHCTLRSSDVLSLISVCAAPGAESSVARRVIDRILATVGGGADPAVGRGGGVAVRASSSRRPQGDPLQWTLDRLIERRLMLIEVDRYGPPEPPRAESTRRMQRDRRTDRIGRAARRDPARDRAVPSSSCASTFATTCGIDAYLQQRFGAAYQPTDEEIVRYYRDTHRASSRADGKRCCPVRRNDAARAGARSRVDRRAAALRRVRRMDGAGLRRRTEV